MSTLDTMVQEFPRPKADRRRGRFSHADTGCNLAYTKFKDAGYEVYAVNPRIASLRRPLTQT